MNVYTCIWLGVPVSCCAVCSCCVDVRSCVGVSSVNIILLLSVLSLPCTDCVVMTTPLPVLPSVGMGPVGNVPAGAVGVLAGVVNLLLTPHEHCAAWGDVQVASTWMVRQLLYAECMTPS